MTLDLPLDDKLAATINRRRIAEEERKRRIFDPKIRQIGLDVRALNHQVHDAQLTKAKEKLLEDAFDEQTKKINDVAIILEKKRQEEVRKLKEEINQFRLSMQKPEYRREFDLYDPDQKKKELPPRISDDDPRCSVSGLQKLEGEDLGRKDRTKNQKDQARELLRQQMHEKKMREFAINKLEKDWESKIKQLDNHAVQMDKLEKEAQRDVVKSTKELNKRLAQETEVHRKQQQMKEELEKQQDIYHQFYGELLSEDPLAARSSFGPHRIVADRWKGMTKDQVEKYYQGQKQQIAENRRKKEQEAQEEAKWDKLLNSQAQVAEMMERQKDNQILQKNKEDLSRNCDLAQIHKMKQDYINKVVYTNEPSESYFSQFNTTSR